MSSKHSQRNYALCPVNPAFHREHLIQTLDLSPNETVPDFTDFIDRGVFVSSGAFGQVYKGRWKGVDKAIAHDRQILPIVAVKIVPLPGLKNKDEQNRRYKRIKRELELWAQLSHDNVLPLIGIARLDGDPNIPAFISPWIEHGTVKEYLEEHPDHTPFGFLQDIMEGVHYLHTFNPVIVHGDIKAANVLVNYRKEAYLCDFGLSRFATENSLWRSSVTSVAGSVPWMAPELFTNEENNATTASDIYAFGMTCWEILAGHVPFESLKIEGNVIFNIISGVRPERVPARQPDTFWKIVTLCWAQELNSRPTSGAALRLVRDAVAQAEDLTAAPAAAAIATVAIAPSPVHAPSRANTHPPSRALILAPAVPLTTTDNSLKGKASVGSKDEIVGLCTGLNGHIQALSIAILDEWGKISGEYSGGRDESLKIKPAIKNLVKKSLGQAQYRSLPAKKHVSDINANIRDALQAWSAFCLCFAIRPLFFGFSLRTIDDLRIIYRLIQDENGMSGWYNTRREQQFMSFDTHSVECDIIRDITSLGESEVDRETFTDNILLEGIHRSIVSNDKPTTKAFRWRELVHGADERSPSFQNAKSRTEAILSFGLYEIFVLAKKNPPTFFFYTMKALLGQNKVVDEAARLSHMLKTFHFQKSPEAFVPDADIVFNDEEMAIDDKSRQQARIKCGIGLGLRVSVPSRSSSNSSTAETSKKLRTETILLKAPVVFNPSRSAMPQESFVQKLTSLTSAFRSTSNGGNVS